MSYALFCSNVYVLLPNLHLIEFLLCGVLFTWFLLFSLCVISIGVFHQKSVLSHCSSVGNESEIQISQFNTMIGFVMFLLF